MGTRPAKLRKFELRIVGAAALPFYHRPAALCPLRSMPGGES